MVVPEAVDVVLRLTDAELCEGLNLTPAPELIRVYLDSIGLEWDPWRKADMISNLALMRDMMEGDVLKRARDLTQGLMTHRKDAIRVAAADAYLYLGAPDSIRRVEALMDKPGHFDAEARRQLELSIRHIRGSK